MSIKLSKLGTANARHTVRVKLPFADGEQEIRIVYRGRSIREYTELDQKYKAVSDVEALPQILAEEILEMPDVVDDGGKDVPITPELFQGIDSWALNRIRKAIQDDRLGNPTD